MAIHLSTIFDVFDLGLVLTPEEVLFVPLHRSTAVIDKRVKFMDLTNDEVVQFDVTPIRVTREPLSRVVRRTDDTTWESCINPSMLRFRPQRVLPERRADTMTFVKVGVK